MLKKIEKPKWRYAKCEAQDRHWLYPDEVNKLEMQVDRINQALENAVEVTGSFDVYDKTPLQTDTHKALLINIQPIEPDSAEKMLSELLENDFFYKTVLRERAKKILGKE